MPGKARRIPISLWALVFVLVFVLLAVDGGVSRAAALDRWVGTIAFATSGLTVDFIVLVDPGTSASFEWRYRNVKIFTGALAANVFGSTVTGTLFPTGGLAVESDPLCCRPCNFRGSIAGNRVDGTMDPVSCGGGGGTFFLIKQ